MKAFNTLSILSSLLISLTAFGHPPETGPVSSVGLGANFKVKGSMNIPPSETSIYYYSKYSEQHPSVRCSFVVSSAEKFDRSISGVLTVVGTEKDFLENTWLVLKSENGNFLKLYCRQFTQLGYEPATLGQAREVLKEVVSIELANPFEL